MENQQKNQSQDWDKLGQGIEEVRLQYVFKSITDGSHYSPDIKDKGRPYVTVSDVGNHSIDLEHSKRISPRDFQTLEQEGCRPQKGDILLAKDGTVGEGAVVKENRFVVLSSLAILRPNPQYNPKYLLYCLTSDSFKQQLKSRMTGAALKRVTLETIKEATVPVGPIEWQDCIVSFLDQKTAQIEEQIKKNQSLLGLLGEKNSSLIERSVLKGVKDERLETSCSLDVIGYRPESWEVRRAKTLFEQRDDRGYNDLPLLEVSLNHGVRLREENEDRNAWTASDLEDMKRVAVDDLVFNKMRLWQGAIGRSDYEGLVSPDYTVLEPRQEANPIYYEHLLRTRAYKTEVNRRSYGVVDDRNRIYWKQFGDMPLLHPSPEEQEEIVERIKRSTNQIDELREKVKDAIELLEEKRQALITAAVTGHIDVSAWEPAEQEAPA